MKQSKSTIRRQQQFRAAGMTLAQAERSASVGTPIIGSGVVAAVALVCIAAGSLVGYAVYRSAIVEAPVVAQAPQQIEVPAVVVDPNAALFAAVQNASNLPEFAAPQSATSLSGSVTEQQASGCKVVLAQQARALVISFTPSGIDAIGDGIVRARQLVNAASDCDGIRIMVEGHTDATGDAANNLALSWDRAEAVIAAIAQDGSDVSMIEAVGYGARRPLAQGDTDDDDNRRVSFKIVPAR